MAAESLERAGVYTLGKTGGGGGASIYVAMGKPSSMLGDDVPVWLFWGSVNVSTHAANISPVIFWVPQGKIWWNQSFGSSLGLGVCV